MQRDTKANIQQENLGFPFTVASLNIIYLVSTHFLSTISITTVHDIRCTTLQFTSENTRQKEQPKLELFSIFYFKPQKWAKLDLSWAKEIENFHLLSISPLCNVPNTVESITHLRLVTYPFFNVNRSNLSRENSSGLNT